MGTPEIVVKRARPCSSTLVPVGAPIGRSGDFSRVGKSVFSAQFFSASEGWRLSNTSAMGLSATCGLDGFFSGMRTCSVVMIGKPARGSKADQSLETTGRSGIQGLLLQRTQRAQGNSAETIKQSRCGSCDPIPTLWRISRKHKLHERGAAAALRVHRGSQGGRNSCK